MKNRSHLRAALVKQWGGTVRQADDFIQSLFQALSESLVKNERIEIRGFGTWVNRVRAAHQGRNPKTGERVWVPEKRVPFFRVGRELRVHLDRKK